MLLGPIKAKLAPQELAKKPDDLYKAKLLYGALTTIAAVGTLFAARSRRTLLAVASGALTAIGLSVLQRLFSFVAANLEERFDEIETKSNVFMDDTDTYFSLKDFGRLNSGDAVAYTIMQNDPVSGKHTPLILRFIATKIDDKLARVEVLPLDETSETYPQALSLLSGIDGMLTIDLAPNAALNQTVFTALLEEETYEKGTVEQVQQYFAKTFEEPKDGKSTKRVLIKRCLINTEHLGKKVQVFCDQTVGAPHLSETIFFTNYFEITLFDQTRYRKCSLDFSPPPGTNRTRTNFNSDIDYKRLIEEALEDFTNPEGS